MNYRKLLTEIRSEDKRVLVCGLGISGLETAKTLNRLGIRVLCAEGQTEQCYEERCKFPEIWEEIKQSRTELLFGADAGSIAPELFDCALCVLSPGIPFDSPFVNSIRAADVLITNELDIAVGLYDCPTVVVTGTNGKSTTVSLIDAILRSAGCNSILCGNVGTPVIAGLQKEVVTPDFSKRFREKRTVLVVEASSYQIESACALSPDVGVFLNLSENHLERHKTMENYFDVKCSLFEAQADSAVAIYNIDDVAVGALPTRVSCRSVPFGESSELERFDSSVRIDYQPANEVDRIEIVRDGSKEYIDLDCTRLLGRHNRYNIAAAAFAALELGATSSDILAALQSFHPLEHRLELVPVPQGDRRIYNDSKSTTPTSTLAALSAVIESFPKRTLSIAIGGQMKRGGDIKEEWQQVCTVLADLGEQLDQLVCFGGDGEELHNLFSAAFDLPSEYGGVMQVAIEQLCGESRSQSLLLFSPGCASFDEYNGFEARGAAFKAIIKSIS